MNRRSLLTFLGLAPVAAATGAVAATPNETRALRGLSAIDADVGGYTLTGERGPEMIMVPRTEYEFEHFGAGFLHRAYKNNILLTLPREMGPVEPYRDEYGVLCSFGPLPQQSIRYQEFVSQDDEVFASVDGDMIRIVNRSTQRTAFAPREALHTTNTAPA